MTHYVLRDVRSHKYVQATLPYSEDEKIRPSWKFDRGLLNVDIQTLPFERDFGKVLTDYVPFLYTGLISNRFVKAFNEHKITGWKSVPVKFKLKRGEIIGNYNFLIVNGVVGSIDYQSGELKERIIDLKVRRSIYKYRQGISFDVNTWDGSDIFMSTDTSGHIFLSEKAKKVIENLKCPNLVIKPLRDVEVDIETL